MDFEKFFDTNRFEMMAREYSEKYNKASVLGENKKDERLKESAKNAFSQAFCLFYMMERSLQGNKGVSREVITKTNQFRGDMRDYLKVHFGDNSGVVPFDKPRVITHKSCVFELLDMTKAFSEAFEILTQTAGFDKNLYSELKAIYDEVLNLTKQFYVHI